MSDVFSQLTVKPSKHYSLSGSYLILLYTIHILLLLFFGHSPTRDRTRAPPPLSGSTESKPLDHQESSIIYILMMFLLCSVVKSCLILCNYMDCSLPGSSVCGVFQARILEQVPTAHSRGSSQSRVRTPVAPALAGDSLPLHHPRSLILMRLLIKIKKV